MEHSNNTRIYIYTSTDSMMIYIHTKVDTEIGMKLPKRTDTREDTHYEVNIINPPPKPNDHTQ